jgi:hypothetical protein
MVLSAPKQATLDRAHRPSIEQEFGGLQNHWLNNSWLRPHNRYRTECVDRIETDLGPPRKLRASHLREYIAASTVLHCMDCWAYLGRALVSYLFGDIDVARHLAYYAELRAAMSLLGTEGVGVFNNQHFTIDRTPRLREINRPGTHVFVWDALEHWSGRSQSRDLLLSVLLAGGQPLREWLNHFTAPVSVLGFLARDWFSRWGLDLQRLSKDRESRNLVSYRPTAFTSQRPSPTQAALRFVRHIWEMCEPSLSMRFRLLDRHLLRQSLEFVFATAHPHHRTRRQAANLYGHRVSAMLHQLNPGDLSTQEWTAFLTFQSDPDEAQLLTEAQGSARADEPGHERQVLSRATLLLRVATGACGLLLAAVPGFAANGISFWWNPLGEDRSVWGNGAAPLQAIDLWADIEVGLAALEAWEVRAGANPSYWDLWRQETVSAAILGTCERIGLWGLGL